MKRRCHRQRLFLSLLHGCPVAAGARDSLCSKAESTPEFHCRSAPGLATTVSAIHSLGGTGSKAPDLTGIRESAMRMPIAESSWCDRPAMGFIDTLALSKMSVTRTRTCNPSEQDGCLFLLSVCVRINTCTTPRMTLRCTAPLCVIAAGTGPVNWMGKNRPNGQ